MKTRVNCLLVLLLSVGTVTHGLAQSRSIEEIIQGIRETVLKPLRAFESETPTNCDSKNLQTAYAAARVTASLAPDLELRRIAADLTLDIAESALKHDCLDFADKVYRSVISTYVGSGYAAHRQRAQIGIDDVRAAKKTK